MMRIKGGMVSGFLRFAWVEREREGGCDVRCLDII